MPGGAPPPNPPREIRRQKRREAEYGANQPPTAAEARAEFEARKVSTGLAIDEWVAKRGLPPLVVIEVSLDAGDEPFGCAIMEIEASLRYRLAVARALQLDGRRNTATAQLLDALRNYLAGRPGPLDRMIDNKSRDNQPTSSDADSRAMIGAAVTTLERSGAYNRTAWARDRAVYRVA